MPQSLSSILIRLVFSTKNRERYIRGQKQHHRRITFQDEYRKFLKIYGIEYDERYVWD
jgi:hypothetical protein